MKMDALQDFVGREVKVIEEREYRELSKQYKMVISGWEGK